MVILPALNKVISLVSKQHLPPKFLPHPKGVPDLGVTVHENFQLPCSPCPQLLSPVLGFIFFFNPSFLLYSNFFFLSSNIAATI